MVFAIGHQHEHLVVVLFFFKRADGFVNRFAKRGAALGDDVRAEGVDALHEGVAVDSQRALQKGGAGEGDQAKPVALGQAHQVEHGELGPLDPVGTLIRGQHASGGVHPDEDVEAAHFRHLPFVVVLGPGQGEHEQGGDDQQQAELGQATAMGEAKRELIGELGVDELGQKPCTPPPCPPEKQPEQRHD